jgi:hypothetical protein
MVISIAQGLALAYNAYIHLKNKMIEDVHHQYSQLPDVSLCTSDEGKRHSMEMKPIAPRPATRSGRHKREQPLTATKKKKMEEKEEGDQTRAGSKDLLAAQMGAVGRVASEAPQHGLTPRGKGAEGHCRAERQPPHQIEERKDRPCGQN